MKYIGNVQSQAESEVFAVASGALPDGKPVIVNSDGTVSVVGAGPASFGAETTFEAGGFGSVNLAATFDSNSNRVVIAYKDEDDSNKGKAVVGSISGTSVTFGTPVQYATLVGPYVGPATFDSNSNKVVIVYRDQGNSNYGTAIVGTVDSSDNSISFGTAVVFQSVETHYPSIVFDSSNNKVVVCYREGAIANAGQANVGTVSGTGISFGSPVTFDSSKVEYISAAYDSNAEKIVVSYADHGNSKYGTGIVGTVSGTSISFGSAAVFNSGHTTYISTTFDSNSNKAVISYTDSGNSTYGTAVVGTVSSTNISFGSEVVFNSGEASLVASVFDSSQNKVAVVYKDSDNDPQLRFGTVSGTSISFSSASEVKEGSIGALTIAFDSNANSLLIAYEEGAGGDKGQSKVYNPAPPNLTAENFLGFTNAAYATGQTATIEVGGAVNSGQSSLTIGQQYFVQTDGTLGTTAASPSVIAGTAVSATDLIVKG